MSTGRGFSLVETTIAALVVAVGVLTVLGADRNARRLGERGDRHLRAVAAAASALDSVRATCRTGTPAVLGGASATVAVGGPEPAAPVRVETLLACGPPP